MESHFINKIDKRVEDLARIFASKLPKETNFNNRKSNKYFHKEETERTTIKDNLLYNFQENPFDSISILVPNLDNINRRSHSKVFKVDKSIVKYFKFREDLQKITSLA
jgi:hypothetical protein